MKGKWLKLETDGSSAPQTVTIAVEGDISALADELVGEDVEFTIAKYRAKRSRDANAYCWVLCAALAEKLSDDGRIVTKEEVYCESIRNVGIFRDIDVASKDAETIRTMWSRSGTGWITEKVDEYKGGDRVLLRCYYGSSVYNAKQMSRLIDCLVQDCQAVGIPTDTPEQIANMLSLWEEDRKRRNER